MSDLRDLPDLVGDIRERVVVPPYADVSRRVRARRARAAVGTLAVVVLVVGGVAVWQNLATTAGPSVPQPADTQGPIPPTDESQWRAVVDGTDSHPFETKGTDDGSIAVVWRALEHPEPTFALVIREADGTIHGTLLDEPVSLTPVPGGWVGLETTKAWFIRTDGRWTLLRQPGLSRAARPGDVAVPTTYGPALYAPGDQSWAFDREVDQAHITPEGVRVGCARDGDAVLVATSTGTRVRTDGRSCVIAGSGETIAVAGLGDGPNGDIPLTSLLRSTDGGYTWTRPSFDAFASFTSQVVGADGTILITGAEGRSFVIHPDGAYTEPTVPLGVAFAAGDRLYATSYGQDKGALLMSRYHGATWQETRLPGLE